MCRLITAPVHRGKTASAAPQLLKSPMKSITSFLAAVLVAITSLSAIAQGSTVPVPNVAARSFALLDYQSNQLIATQKADERTDPASLTKLMTAYLTFAAVKQKRLALTQAIPIS